MPMNTDKLIIEILKTENMLLQKELNAVKISLDKRWDEDEHPRDDKGQFTDKDDVIDDVSEDVATNVPLDNDKYVIAEAKIKQFLLLEGAKHSQDFFDVGYTAEDWQQLNDDIYNQFDESKATDFWVDSDGNQRFNIYMYLGVTKTKRFVTVWLNDPQLNNKPRFITAFRKDG